MSETVLVTGGNGFVGGWCIVELLRRGYAVRCSVRSQAKEPLVRNAVAKAGESSDRLTVVEADLTNDKGWGEAAAGCDYVLHVASPLVTRQKQDENDLIDTAREGTLRVLRAAAKAGVKRVVVTSSTAACTPPPQSGPYSSNETVWTDPAGNYLDAYRRSKVLAERAAWDFIKGNAGPMTLTTILPAGILGPVLTTDNLGSVQFVQRLLKGSPPAIPRIGFCIIDVRDLAALHVTAMIAPEAAGQRFIASGEFFWMKQIADTLRNKLGDRARKVPTRELPDFLLRAVSWVAPPFRMLVPMLGRELHFSPAKSQRTLGFTPRPAIETILDCAESLFREGVA